MSHDSDPPAESNGESANGEPANANGEARATAPSRPSSTPPPATPEQRLADALGEAAKVRDQLLRTAADFDNFRKRSRREQEDAQRRGREGVLKDLLPVFDNLERAASHADGAPDVKAVADGLRIVMKQFESTLERLGVKRIAAIGLPFDPSVHEAIQHLESAEHPAGVVLAEVQPGYTIGDHLLRAALVVVSKGSPEGAPAQS